MRARMREAAAGLALAAIIGEAAERVKRTSGGAGI
jgi:hypothetical protein